jgi:hypothetical protein
MKGAVQAIGGAHQVQQRLLFHAEEGRLLHDFEFQATHRSSHSFFFASLRAAARS